MNGVMAGLDPAIHHPRKMDHRVSPLSRRPGDDRMDGIDV
jgi:hypothetical protein